MEVLFTALVTGLIVGLTMRANYRGHINDLREALDHERKMRRLEEARAETLSDALFGRTRSRQHGNKKLRN
jgi:hypothetical protein